MFRGNAASGGWSGFSLVNLPAPIGDHRPAFTNMSTCATEPVAALDNPSRKPFGLFDGNTAHSSGTFVNVGAWCVALCDRLRSWHASMLTPLHVPSLSMYVGGLLWEVFDPENNCEASLVYNSGRHARYPFDASGDVSLYFYNTRVWMCRRGLNTWGAREDVINFESHDVKRSTTLFGHAYVGSCGSGVRIEAGFRTCLRCGAATSTMYW